MQVWERGGEEGEGEVSGRERKGEGDKAEDGEVE